MASTTPSTLSHDKAMVDNRRAVSTLLMLLGELRNQIYKHLFDSATAHRKYPPHDYSAAAVNDRLAMPGARRFHPSMVIINYEYSVLLVCRQIQREAYPLLVSFVHLTWTESLNFDWIVEATGKERARTIRSITSFSRPVFLHGMSRLQPYRNVEALALLKSLRCIDTRQWSSLASWPEMEVMLRNVTGREIAVVRATMACRELLAETISYVDSYTHITSTRGLDCLGLDHRDVIGREKIKCIRTILFINTGLVWMLHLRVLRVNWPALRSVEIRCNHKGMDPVAFIEAVHGRICDGEVDLYVKDTGPAEV